MTKYGRDGGVGIRIAEVVAFYKLEGVLADSGGGGPLDSVVLVKDGKAVAVTVTSTAIITDRNE